MYVQGGVRIEKNPSLCYVETVDWQRIIMDPIHKEHHVFIEENMDRISWVFLHYLKKKADNNKNFYKQLTLFMYQGRAGIFIYYENYM